MLKVFMKIPGVPRPCAVVGRYLFEDERYLVIAQDILRRKILLENILYIEEIFADDASKSGGEDSFNTVKNTQLESADAGDSVTKEATSQVTLTVAFTGALNRLFTIDGVSSSLISRAKWTPDLAKLIFTNPEIKTVLGSFVIKDIVMDGQNITIVTDSEKKDAAMADIQSKVDLVNQIATAATKFGAPRKGRPSMRIPTDFSMSSSPFTKPVPFTSVNDDMEDISVDNREEEGPGKEGNQ